MKIFIDDGSTNIKLAWLEDGDVKTLISPNSFKPEWSFSLLDDAAPANYEIDGEKFSFDPLSADAVVTTETRYQYSDVNVVAIQHALQQTGLKAQPVDVIVTLPISEYLDANNQKNKQNIERKKKNVMREVRVQGSDAFVIRSVSVLPESIPAGFSVLAVSLTREFTNLMILRGVSKFYAAPGMRLGYGITGNLEFLKKMKEKQVPWSLNSLGALAGELMLQDKAYIRQTRDLILSERTRLLKALENIPTYKTYPAYANFLLLKIQKPGLTSRDVFDACIRQGLMIRDCSSFECLDGEYIRFCIMHPQDNTRLLHILESL